MTTGHATHARTQRLLVPGLTLIGRTVAAVSGSSPQHSGQGAAVLRTASGKPSRQLNCVAASEEKESIKMLTIILGARLSWHFANAWVFEPAIVGPDSVKFSPKKVPHLLPPAIHLFFYQRPSPRAH